ncbi:sulfate adenylyltransferase subunit 1 [Angustibacter sp. Root456]|uniref:sulfate adenylyltransferase subunit 1 n=1 Tax=Angustibacter sp. Root456 TaxID=1736539 RepID=UPI0009E8D288|nr:GTP-binding protein [Angustibacter sp. Root456]
MTSTLLRVATAGSVDDGKSTLLGRLLHDAKGVLEDQLASVADASERRGTELDLSLLTDGLRAEREQGITIDVAYRYFATPARTFVLADTPGHVQYTRNMVTGASTADVAVVLVDVRHGISEQSRRHAAVAALLRVPHVVLVVNKMDLVGWSEAAFERVVREFRSHVTGLGFDDVLAVPVSALHGDNVVHRSVRAPWYVGPTVLEHLEQVEAAATVPVSGLRFAVQYVVRAADRDYRGYAGRVAGGTVSPGDDVVVLPSGVRTTVAAVETYDGPVGRGVEGQSVVVRLADDVDVSRGCVIADVDDAPPVVRQLEATVCWLAEQPLVPGRYLLKHGTRTTRAEVRATGVLDVTSAQLRPANSLALNDIGRVAVRTAEPLPLDDYARNRRTGAFVLIDELSGATVAAGMAGRLPWGAG